jgi:hypothetical protein
MAWTIAIMLVAIIFSAGFVYGGVTGRGAVETGFAWGHKVMMALIVVCLLVLGALGLFFIWQMIFGL